MSQEKIDQFYGEWYDHPDLQDLAPEEYRKRLREVSEALDDYRKEDRPLNILAVHGSGRHPVVGCAHELSNSQLLLERALDPYRNEGYDIESVSLREYNISPCNGCVSTASMLCGFPCVAPTERVTSADMKPIAEVRAGEKISTGVVERAWCSSPYAEIFEVAISDGRRVKLTGNHPIKVVAPVKRRVKLNGAWQWIRDEKWVKVEDLSIGDSVPFPLGGDFNEVPTYGTSIYDFTLAGLVFGDGSIADRQVFLYSPEKEIRAFAISNSPYSCSEGAHNTQNNPFGGRSSLPRVSFGKEARDVLVMSIGLDKTLPVDERRIPSSVMQGTEAEVCAFMRGWFSADGSLTQSAGKKDGFVLYSRSTEALRDAQLLLSKLRIRSRLYDLSHLKDGRGYTRSSSLEISQKESALLFQSKIGSLVPGKALDETEIRSRRNNEGRPSKIVSVASCGYVPVYDLQISESHEFVVEGVLVHNCDCFPFDPMQDLYPRVLRCDVLLCSTGVNQSAMSTRLKTFCDRLISLDGGFLRSEYTPKTSEFRNQAIHASRDGHFEYTQRMFGRVAAYFISSKDEDNPTDSDFGYIRRVADSLKKGFEDYGMLHADKWYVGNSSKWDEDYSHDKRRLNEDTDLHREAQAVVGQAIYLAEELRKNPPEPEMGRRNRT